MKTPVASSSERDAGPGRAASSRLSGRTAATSPAPSLRNSASYTSTISSPRLDAVGMTDDPGLGPTAGRDELLEDGALAELVLGAADDHQRPAEGEVGASATGDRGSSSATSGMTGKASRCQSAPVSGQSRDLVVMRHAKAEPGGETDHERELAAARLGRRARGRPLAGRQRLRARRTRWCRRPGVRRRRGWRSRRAARSRLEATYSDEPVHRRDRRPRSTWSARPTTTCPAAGRGRAQPDDGLPRAAARRRHRRRGVRARDGDRLPDRRPRPLRGDRAVGRARPGVGPARRRSTSAAPDRAVRQQCVRRGERA